MVQCRELFDTRGTALRIERFIKTLGRTEKEQLIENPGKLKSLVEGHFQESIEIKPYRLSKLGAENE
jgi:predicted GIY-YIG superfamily endonuclease